MTTLMIYQLVTPILILFLRLIRPFLSGKIREMLEDKIANGHMGAWNFKNINEPELKQSLVLWIHAASGEIEYARPVIREIKRIHPDYKILVTYSSPSAKKILRSIADIDVWGPLPWDTSSAMTRFIKRFNPQALMVARTDLWPLQALTCKKLHVPVYLFSATFAQNSSRLHGLAKNLTKISLEATTQVFVVSQSDLNSLKELNLSAEISVLGDTRYDQVIHRLKNPQVIKESLRPENATFILGSTWPEDEDQLLPLLPSLKAQGWTFIIAPHETQSAHLEQIESHLVELNMSFQRYTQTDKLVSDVLIIDTVGILAEIYQWGHAAFVGGSFKKQVHSVMEPLAAGLPVFVGPHHLNNREALLMQQKTIEGFPMVQSNSQALDWRQSFEELSKPEFRHRLNQGIKNEIEKLSGSTPKLVQKIFSDLDAKNL